MSTSPPVTSNKKTMPFIVKLVVSLVAAGPIIILGILLITLNFSEASGSLIASISTASPPSPAHQLAQDGCTDFNITVAEELDNEPGS